MASKVILSVQHFKAVFFRLMMARTERFTRPVTESLMSEPPIKKVDLPVFVDPMHTTMTLPPLYTKFRLGSKCLTKSSLEIPIWSSSTVGTGSYVVFPILILAELIWVIKLSLPHADLILINGVTTAIATKMQKLINKDSPYKNYISGELSEGCSI